MWPRFEFGETQSWAIGAAFAVAVHGIGLAAMIGGDGRAPQAMMPVPINVELGAESQMQQEQSDIAPGERQQEAAPPRPQDRTPTPEILRAPQGDIAMAEPVPRASDAPPNELPPAPDTTAPQTMASAAPRAHPPRTATYEQILMAHIERNMRYPRAARSRHQEGVAMVRFQMDRQGRVLEAHLTRSAGHDLLDEEAIATVQRAQPMPTPPHTIAGTVIELTVPVEFDLR